MLEKPCPKCPFRHDIPAYLNKERAEEIADALRGGSEFPCHSTLDYDVEDDEPGRTEKTSFCAGAMTVLEKSEGPNQMMRIMERLGLYNFTKLDMDAPVYDDLDEWIDAQGEGVA